MKKKIVVNILTGEGLDELVTATEKFETKFKEKSKEIVKRLADEGCQIAEVSFGSAAYDGTNDVKVGIEDRGENIKAVVASGSAVLFIEFGTGVTYPDDHPEKPPGVMGRGSYGYKLGRFPSGWRYPASHGAGTSATEDPKHPGYLHTYGNPASKSMYDTTKRLRERLPEIVREVFSND